MKDMLPDIPGNVLKIINLLENAGFEAFIVGGCVRDAVLGRVPNDWDITTNAAPSEVKKIFRRTFDTGIAHGTVTVLMGDEHYEVTTYRVDGVYADHRHPDSVTFTSSLEEDLKRRDFTINAMAYNPGRGLVDLFGGSDDIACKRICCVGNPRERFDEDALRILRAFRFSAQLDFDIDGETLKATSEKASDLKYVSAERICTELLKLIMSDHPEKLDDAYKAGVTKYFLPEYDAMALTTQVNPHHYDTVAKHTINAMKGTPPDRILRLTMLLHDSGKPAVSKFDESGVQHFRNHGAVSAEIAKNVMHRLRLDNDTIKKVCTLIRYHDWHIQPDEANVRKLISEIGPEMFELFVKVQYADVSSHSGYRKEEKLQRIVDEKNIYDKVMERGDCVSLKDLQLTGEDIKKLGLKPGPRIGAILEAAFDEVLKDPSKNDHEYLVGFAKNFLNTEI